RIGLPVSVPEDAGTLADSPEGICICPAIVRRKGQKLVSHTGNGGTAHTSLLHTSEFRSGQMSFVCPNRTAYRVLKDTMPGKMVPGPTSHTSQLPQGSAPDKYEDSVVIYRGHVYLSTRRKKLRVTLPQTSQKPLKSLLPETESQSTTDQESLFTHNNVDVSSSTAAHSPAGGEQAAEEEEAAGTEPAWCQPPPDVEVEEEEVLCVRLCVFYTTMCLAGWPRSSEAARLRCGTDLLSDLIFAQRFQAVFQKRLSEHLGAPDSPKRDAYRKKTQPSLRRKGKGSPSRKRIKTQNPTSVPPLTPGSSPQTGTTSKS
ncbi:hypothetical protein FQN60_002155, partial [Etheostoma spectabile]